MSTPATPIPDLAQFAVAELVKAGQYTQATELTLAAQKQQLKFAPAAPPAPAASDAGAAGGLMTYKQMRAMTVEAMGDLTATPEGRKQIDDSLKALSASGERHNRASSEG